MDATASDRIAAVGRSVHIMRADVGGEHSLRELAQSALLSPFHFHRVFRELTDSTPARYLAAERMSEAKRLLVRTSISVTDICMRVGYSSLGTFTSQFTRLVGVSPRRFRQLVGGVADQSFTAILAQLQTMMAAPATVQLTAEVTEGSGVAVAGLFPSGIPQGIPAACAIVSPPSLALFGGLQDGIYYLLAMSFHPSVTVAEALVADEGCFVGSCATPVRVSGGRATPAAPVLRLRPRTSIDPPLVLALPLLQVARMTAGNAEILGGGRNGDSQGTGP
ncbi:MAG: helix-turn-helix transcriptional regulator [Chloroflexi bacterium]|nr:helix-turn-helix transcriptional regulator [Acidobacteriota bacterium]MCA1587969.1 helix-turn-helix transcriptional regulator [Chloroflexota bacterium]MCA1719552.1 helix-turn-helix transcriptional regulator [Actinomycetota bacterium]